MNEQEMIEAGYKNLGYSNGWTEAFHAETMALWKQHGGRSVQCRLYRATMYAIDNAKVYWITSL